MILVYKAYLYRSYVSQTEDCRLQCCTHCTVTMLQPSPHVTCHTCLPTPWSPGPVIVADTRRSCSCGAFCGWRAHSVTRCCHVCRVWAAGHVSRVTLARLGQHHCHQVTPAAAGTCGHWWLAAPCAVVSGHHLVQPHCWWRGWDRSAVGQPVCGVAGGSPPAVVLAASLAAAY